MIREMFRHSIWVFSLLFVISVSSAFAANLTIAAGETYTVTGTETVAALDVRGTLIVESTGTLTFTSRSAIKGVGAGGHIIVNGGTIIGNARLDMDQTGTITMNGGLFRVNGSVKFPDNAPGPVYMFLNGGVFSALDIQTIPDRNPHYTVGGGVLRLDGNVENNGQQYDPRLWIALGFMVPAEGYGAISVEYIAAGNYTEVRATPLDPHPAVSFLSSFSQDIETITQVNIPVGLSLSWPETVTVDYAITGGTAVNGTDYILAAGTLTFQPNQTTHENIALTIIDDGLPEDEETLIIALFNPSDNAMLGLTTQYTYLIIDNTPKVTFATAASSKNENISPVNIPVRLLGQGPVVASVDYSVTGGNALGNGVDYTLEDGTLQFGAYVDTQFISIALVNDGLDEYPDETIEITLSNPINAKLGTITHHTFTLMPPVSQPCPTGNLNNDCEVDILDLAIFASQWLDDQGLCSGVDPDCANLDGLNGVSMPDFALFTQQWLAKGSLVVINEFMASNGITIEDPDEPGEYPDWIELYNAGSETINLGGVYLTDNLDVPTKWRIPDGVTIEPGQYLVFWADGDDLQGDYHTNFQLAGGGEKIGLFDTDGTTLIDSISYDSQTTDVSYGRYPDVSNNWRFLGTPTPGNSNQGAYLGAVEDTKFSHNRGFYDAPFNLTLTCQTPDAIIKYTTDGTKPTENHGLIYSTPIAIASTTCVRAAAFKSGWQPTNIDTNTYLFLNDVLTQLDSGVVSTYGPTVIKNAFKSIPTLSIVKNSAEPIIDGGLIPADQPLYGATSVEMIYADPNDRNGFQSDCQIVTHSHDRGAGKQAYRLEWKTEFGPASLEYPFFASAPVNAESAVDHFDRIILRAASNMPITYVGDPWTAQSQIAMSGLGSHSNHVHLYINGQYRGVYNPKERPDARFTSAYLGGEFEDYFATNHGIERCPTGNIPASPCHLSGDNTRFASMMTLAYEANLENPSKYDEFATLCDVTQFCDYTILFWMSGFGDNMDNNWYAGMRNNPPGGFMMFMWDAEMVFLNMGSPPGSSVPWVPYYYFNAGYMISDLWRAMMDNIELRLLFADRVYKHCFNGGAMTDQNAQARWNVLTSSIAQAVLCEKARWGGSDIPTPVNMTGKVNTFINALRAWSDNRWPGAKLYPAIDPPSFQHGGIVSPGYQLSMSGSGTIYHTLNGTDPRAVGGAAAGTVYSGPITLNQSTRVKARAKTTVWSALHEVVFGVGPVKENLRITELMYHPANPSAAEILAGFTTDEEFEYIELTNINTTESINLALVSFTNGIDYTFPSYSLAAGEYIVVAKNPAAFAVRYPSVPSGKVLGPYTGTGLFDNDGERVVLQDAIGQTIHDFEYNDTWYPLTDGAGFSLTILNPDDINLTMWDQKIGWRASTLTGGSPGQSEAGLAPGSIVINELLAHSHDTTPDWIELYNTTTQSISISGWFLSDDPGNLTKYTIADNTEIPAGGFMVFYQDQHFGSAFALSENGETIFLTSGAGGQITGYQAVQQFDASARDVTLGRYLKSDGDMDFVAMSSPTPSTANAYPGVGPIVISEIQYNPAPANTGDEYIELRNISGQTVVLQELVSTETAPGVFVEETISWSFTDGIDYIFPANTQIAAGKSLIVAKNPAEFNAYYTGLPLGTQVLGPFANSTSLSNGGEKVRLCRPGEQPLGQPRSWIRADQVTYDDESPWPTTPDGGGDVLQRINDSEYGNDWANWTALNPAPGQ